MQTLTPKIQAALGLIVVVVEQPVGLNSCGMALARAPPWPGAVAAAEGTVAPPSGIEPQI